MKTTKRIFAMLLCAIMITAFIPAHNVYASTSGTCGDDVTWELNGTTLTIDGTGNMSEYTSHSEVPWYDNSATIRKVIINDGVAKISPYAFTNCSKLTDVTLPNSLTCIGKYAFAKCTCLTSLTIPDSVTSIEDYAFYYCTNFSVKMGSGITSIGDYAFSWCYLSTLTLPESLIQIGNYAFSACYGLKSIIIPSSVTSIGTGICYSSDNLVSASLNCDIVQIPDYAFKDCSSLTSIDIPSSVTSIGSQAFYYCRNLSSVYISDLESWCKISFTNSSSNPLYCGGALYLNNELVNELTIPSSITSIGDYAFYNCTSLTSITIPDSVTSIGAYAFNGCIGLTSITIPESVTSIYNYAFRNCTGLTSITIPDSVTSIGNYAFYGCNSLCSVTLESSVIGSHAFEECTNLTSVLIGDEVTTIEDDSFYGCSNLTNVTIGSGVTRIGNHVFTSCGNVDISVDTNNLYYSSEDGVLFNKDKSELVIYAKDNVCTEYMVPDSVTTIGNYAFYDCTGLKYVDMGTGVTFIGLCAFYNCNSLTNITIPNSVTRIANMAFCLCDGMTCAYYLGSQTDWEEISVGSNNTALTSVLRYAVSDIEITKWDSGSEIYISDYDSLEVFDECTFSVEVTVPADTELLTFDKSDWVCPAAETSGILQSSAIDFGEVSVLGPYALEDDENYKIYYVSITGELKEKGDFTLTFNSPNDAVSSTDISIERYYTMWIDNWSWQHSSFISVASEDVRPFYMSSKAFYRIFPQHNAKSNKIYSKLNPIISADNKAAGMCNGLAVSSAMIYQGMPSLDLLGSDAEYAHDVSVSDIHLNLWTIGLELHEFIEAIHASQYMEEIAAQDKAHKNNYSDLISAVSDFEQTGDNPVAITISSAMGYSAHVLIGYKAEKTDDEYKVYVYDCNYPNDSQRYITFPLNSKGNPTGWSYTEQEATAENDYEEKIWNSNKIGSYITYEDDFTDIYNQLLSTVGMELKSITLFEENSESSDLIVSTSDNFTITVDGQSVSCAEGAFSNEENTSLIPVIQKNYIPGTEYSFEDVFFYCSSETALKIENDSDTQSVSLSISDDNSEITITSDGHSVVEIGETDDVFDITVTPSESGNSVTITYTTEESVIEITGETDDSVSLQADSGESEITISGFTLASVTTEYGGITDTYKLNSEDETVISVNTESSAWSINSYADGIITLTSPSDTEGDYYVTIAQYDDDGILIDCEIAVLTAESEKNYYQIATEKSLSTGKIKIMLWDENLIPLTEAYEY